MTGFVLLRPAVLRLAALIFGAALLLPLAPLAAHADDMAMAQNLSTNVTQVLSTGAWVKGDKSGFYRAVVVASGPDQQHLSGKVFLQWLSADQSEVAHVEVTVPVKEINTLGLTDLGIDLVEDEKVDGKVMLVVDAYDPRTDQSSTYYVVATEPGKYTFSKTPPPGFNQERD